jgi:kynurenine formamidase
VANDPAVLLAPEALAWLRGLAAEHRHGERDRLGSANLIDVAARRRGAAAATSGRTASLSRDLRQGPNTRKDGAPSFELEVHWTDGPIGMASDHVELDCHGRVNTHLDGLNHISVDGTFASGWAAPGGGDGPEISDFRDGLVTRGVYVDVPAGRGTSWVDPAEPVTADDIERSLVRGGITFEPGDALLLDMGRDRFEAAGASDPDGRISGLGRSGAEWVADHGVSLLCWDFLDAMHPDEPLITGHGLIWAIGLLLVDNCDFGRLRAALAAEAGHPPVGLLVVSPLPIEGGTGSNVNPLVLL